MYIWFNLFDIHATIYFYACAKLDCFEYHDDRIYTQILQQVTFPASEIEVGLLETLLVES